MGPSCTYVQQSVFSVLFLHTSENNFPTVKMGRRIVTILQIFGVVNSWGKVLDLAFFCGGAPGLKIHLWL